MPNRSLLDNSACHPCADHETLPQVISQPQLSPPFLVRCPYLHNEIGGLTPERAIADWNLLNPPRSLPAPFPLLRLPVVAETEEALAALLDARFCTLLVNAARLYDWRWEDDEAGVAAFVCWIVGLAGLPEDIDLAPLSAHAEET